MVNQEPVIEHRGGPGAAGADPVRDYILGGLAEGRLKPGDRLPTERQFSERFGRPRGSVRKTLAILEAEGWILRAVGRGTFLSTRATSAGAALGAVAPDTSPAALMEARLLLEPQLADLVVRNATAADLREIEECLDRSRTAGSIDEFERWDGALHLAITRATHNDFLVRVMELMNRARQTSEWGQLKMRALTAARRQVSTAEHAAIVDALRRRDADLARTRIREHLLGVRRNLLGY
ncbi:MAG TPA: FadR/GntR family transcriptional regulator [Thermodesulfobacteriota bacterium]